MLLLGGIEKDLWHKMSEQNTQEIPKPERVIGNWHRMGCPGTFNYMVYRILCEHHF